MIVESPTLDHALTAYVLRFLPRIALMDIESILCGPRCARPQRLSPALLRGVELSDPTSPNVWTLSFGTCIRVVSNPKDPPFASLALSLLTAASSVSMVLTPMVIVFLPSTDSKNLSLCHGLANFNTVGRGFRHPEPLTPCHLPRQSTLSISTRFGISIVRSRPAAHHLTPMSLCLPCFIKGSGVPGVTTLRFLSNSISVDICAHR